MAASSKYDMPSNSPDGPSFPTRQRGPYAAASLEKSGSFREVGESRVQSSLPSMLRPGSVLSQSETGNLFQSVVSDLKPMVVDQKFPRPGEMKRLISSIIGVSSEDSIPPSYSTRPLTSPALEELRRIRSSLNECSVRARDRAKAFAEATSKIDKCCHSMMRKRPRADVSSSERSNVMLPAGSVPRTGPQSHLTANGLDNGSQKSEERTKNVGPSRRVRTTRPPPQMDVRANGATRPSGLIERDKDTLKLVSGGATPLEEKGRVLPAGVDGWDKSKMKKKRSVIKPDVSANAILVKPLDGDREAKRGMQQKLINDARPRLNSTHGFRSGPVTAATGVDKSDSASQPNGLGTRPFPRNDQDNGSLSIDRRDRPIASDKDGPTLKGSNKPNVREDNCAASPSATAHINASTRGPRSNSGSLSKVSPSIHRAAVNSDDWEHPQCVNKLSASVGGPNRKRSNSTCSPSPSVTQWGGQRPQKLTRVARRSTLTPSVPGHNETSASDMADSAAVNDDGLPFTRRSSSNASQQSKLKGDLVSLSGLSESEESGAVDDKAKDKGKKCSEIEERAGPTIQKVATVVLPSRKNKLAFDQDIGDGERRQGRIGRGFTPTKSGTPAAIEKLDNAQWRNGRIGSEKIESKTGRPPTKKFSERKGYTRPRHSVNNAPIEFAGESDDDHEELLAAANAALDTSQACSSTFWKQIDPVFGFLSTEDLALLNQQIRLMDEAAVGSCLTGNGLNSKGDLGSLSLPSTPAIACRDDYSTISNGFSLEGCDRDIGLSIQAKNVDPFLEQFGGGNVPPNRISICQVLLSAIIEEGEIGNYDYINNNGDEHFDDARGVHFEFEEELKPKGSNFHSLGNFQAPERTPNGYRINAGRTYLGEVAYPKLGSNGILVEPNIEGHACDELLPNPTMACISSCTDFQYNQMSFNDRILMELSEIGLYPEPVPDLAQCEEEDINKTFNVLEENLLTQVAKKRRVMSKLEKAVMEEREHQQRTLERLAMDKLVGMAYEKYMACWGPNVSSSKNVSKITKHAALSFLRRTLARYQKFVESGISCFNEPPFRDMFLSASPQNISVNTAAFKGAVNQLAPTLLTETISIDNARPPLNPVQGSDTHSDAFRSVNHSSEQMFGREDPWSNKAKKKELLLDDVVGATFRVPSGLGSSLASGAKGKRSEREGKGQNRDTVSRNGTAKIGRPALSNVKGERKNKPKPKQKIAQLSASVNGLLSKPTDTMLPRDGGISKDGPGLIRDPVGTQDASNEADTMEFLPDIDIGGNGQDIGSWLNIEDDGLLDQDFMGLEIPMDDLSEVNMMI